MPYVLRYNGINIWGYTTLDHIGNEPFMTSGADISTNHYLKVTKGGTPYYVGLTTNSAHPMATGLKVKIGTTTYYVCKASRVEKLEGGKSTAGTVTLSASSIQNADLSAGTLVVSVRGAQCGNQGGGGGGGGASARNWWDNVASSGAGGSAGHYRQTRSTVETSHDLTKAQMMYINGYGLTGTVGSGGVGSGGGSGGGGQVLDYANNKTAEGTNGSTAAMSGSGGSSELRLGTSGTQMAHDSGAAGVQGQSSRVATKYKHTAISMWAEGGNGGGGESGYGGGANSGGSNGTYVGGSGATNYYRSDGGKGGNATTSKTAGSGAAGHDGITGNSGAVGYVLKYFIYRDT